MTDTSEQQSAALLAWAERVFGSDPRRSPDDVCYGFEDGMDGFAVHAEACPSVGHAASGPNSSCPRRGRWRGPWPVWAREAGERRV